MQGKARVTICCASWIALACSPDAASVAGGTQGGESSGSAATAVVDASTSTVAAESTSADASSSSTGPVALLDVGGPEPGDPLDRGCAPSPDQLVPSSDPEGGSLDTFSNIWFADATNALVYKADARTAQMRAVYRTAPDSGGSPSRTSVNRNADVAIANRGTGVDGEGAYSGVTVIATRRDDCIDRDGDGIIHSSTGPHDPLDWEQDECVLWHTPLASRSNHAVAWTRGTYDEATCRWRDLSVWTASAGDEATQARVALLDGKTGDLLDEVVVEPWPDDMPNGAFGGAVDSNDDFWVVARGEGVEGATASTIARVSLTDLSYEIIQGPYLGDQHGIMVDREDRVWISNGNFVSRYDPVTDSWQTGGDCYRCKLFAESRDGRVWTNGPVEIDTETLTPVVPQESSGRCCGLAFDVDDRLWQITTGSMDDSTVLRLDIANSVVDQWSLPPGVIDMYTFMTGWGLRDGGEGPG